MKKLLILFLVFSSLTAAAQNCNFSGRVFMQNSENITPVANVGIYGKNQSANLVHSTQNGEFCLKFGGLRPGAKIELVVEQTYNGNVPIEVINDREMSTFLPENKNEGGEVIVCLRGEKQVAVAKFYKLLRNASDVELKQMRQAYAALKEKLGETNERVKADADKIAKYERENDSLSFYREAYELASINKRKASTRMREFIQMLEKGVPLQEARKVLSLDLASKEGRQAAHDYRSIRDELTRLSSVHARLNERKAAENCIDSLLAISDDIGVKPSMMIDAYVAKAGFLQDRGGFQEAIRYLKTVVSMLEKQPDVDKIVLAELYVDIARSYDKYADEYGWALMDEEYITNEKIKKAKPVIKDFLETAISYHKKALAIYESVPDNSELVKEQAGSIAEISQRLGKDWTTFKYARRYLKAQYKEMAEENQAEAERLGAAMSKYATAGHNFMRQKQYDSALVYYNKANNIGDNEWMHYLLGVCYLRTNSYQNADKWLLRVEHPKDTIIKRYVYHQLGMTSIRTGNLAQARTYFSKLEKRIGTDSLSTLDWAVYYAASGDRDKAISNLKTSVNLGTKDAEWIETERSFDIIREDDRYKQLMKRLDAGK